eukprot:snap_masked-scaffold_39-processed-gene-1.25-mRNA-1 protein AED:0.34 eAED:0.35 QI:0/-1/0/1/-1/1/1/0/1006
MNRNVYEDLEYNEEEILLRTEEEIIKENNNLIREHLEEVLSKTKVLNLKNLRVRELEFLKTINAVGKLHKTLPSKYQYTDINEWRKNIFVGDVNDYGWLRCLASLGKIWENNSAENIEKEKKVIKEVFNSLNLTTNQLADLNTSLDEVIKNNISLRDFEKIFNNKVHGRKLINKITKISSEKEYELVPVYFLSGTFKGPQLTWSISEKEMVPIMHVLLRFQFIIRTTVNPLDIYTDHKNLLFILNPPKNIKKSTLSRLHRWALLIQQTPINVYHCAGTENRMADLLTRWGYSGDLTENEYDLRYRTNEKGEIIFGDLTLRTNAVKTRSRNKYINPLELENIPEEELGDLNTQTLSYLEEKQWKNWRDERLNFLHPKRNRIEHNIDTEELKYFQSLEEKPKNSSLKENLLWVDKKLWIPNELIDKFLIMIHLANKHGSVVNDIITVQSFYFKITLKRIKEAVVRLHNICLHCDKFPAILRRPLGEIPHASKPNIVLHVDYIYIHHGYLLVIVDDFSRKTWLTYSRIPDSNGFVQDILGWAANNGLSGHTILVSDKGSHFTSKVASQLKEHLGYSHRFTIVYSPWSNGGVERRNREILRIFRSLCSEYQLNLSAWPKLTLLVLHYINNRKLSQKLNLSPNQIYFGRDKYGEIIVEAQLQQGAIKFENSLPVWDGKYFLVLDETENLLKYLEDLRTELTENDENLWNLMSNERNRQREIVNSKIHADDIQYGPGDLILYSISSTMQEKDKLQLKWNGPAYIQEVVGNNLYKILTPLGEVKEVHSRRIRIYLGQKLPFTETIKSIYAYNQGKYDVDKLLDVQELPEGIRILVQWRGFESQHSTWENYDNILKKLPEEVEQFLDNNKNDALCNKLLQELTLNNMNNRNISQVIRLTEYPDQLRMNMDYNEPYLSRSKGWSDVEDKILSQCVQAYGLGNWQPILDKLYLAGKTRSQLVDRVKHLIGDQQLSPYRGLHISLNVIKEYTSKLIGNRENGRLTNDKEHLRRMKNE